MLCGLKPDMLVVLSEPPRRRNDLDCVGTKNRRWVPRAMRGEMSQVFYQTQRDVRESDHRIEVEDWIQILRAKFLFGKADERFL